MLAATPTVNYVLCVTINENVSGGGVFGVGRTRSGVLGRGVVSARVGLSHGSGFRPGLVKCGSVVCTLTGSGGSRFAAGGSMRVFPRPGSFFRSLLRRLGGTGRRVGVRFCVFGSSRVKGGVVSVLVSGTRGNIRMELLCSTMNDELFDSGSVRGLGGSKMGINTFFPSFVGIVGFGLGCEGREGVIMVSNGIKFVNKGGVKSRCLNGSPGFKC